MHRGDPQAAPPNSTLQNAIESDDYGALGDNPKISQDQFEKMVEANKLKTAVENNDYSSLGDNPSVTEDQFNTLVQAYGLAQDGKYQDAKTLLDKADLEDIFSGFGGFGMRSMMGRGHMGEWLGHSTSAPDAKFNPVDKEAVTAALDAGDYNAWVAAVGADSAIAQKINSEDNFSKYVQAYNLMKQADSIMNDLGLKQGMGPGMGRPGMGMGWFK